MSVSVLCAATVSCIFSLIEGCPKNRFHNMFEEERKKNAGSGA